MASEDELLAKLSTWVKTQIGSISVFNAIETGDIELVAAYVLAAFRAAARNAVVDQFNHEVGSIAPDRAEQSKNVVLRLFDGLACTWTLADDEQQRVLGLGELAELSRLRSLPEAEVPIEIIKRVAIMLEIFIAINAILQKPERADAWMHKRNSSPPFGDKSPIEFMAEGQLLGLRTTLSYLWSSL